MEDPWRSPGLNRVKSRMTPYSYKHWVFYLVTLTGLFNPLDKIWSRRHRALKFGGLVAYVMLCISQFQAPTSPLPPGKPLGKFFCGGQKPCPGQNFLVLKDLVSFSCWWASKILEFLQKSNLKKNWKAPSHTMFKVIKFSPSFETDFETREQQQMIDLFETEKCLHMALTDNLVLW